LGARKEDAAHGPASPAKTARTRQYNLTCLGRSSVGVNVETFTFWLITGKAKLL